MNASDDRQAIGVEVPILEPDEEVLLKIMFDLGLSQSGNSLQYSDIESYIRLSGIPMTLQDIHDIKQCSSTFVSKYNYYTSEKGKKEGPPLATELTIKAQQEAYNAARKESLKARIAANAAGAKD